MSRNIKKVIVITGGSDGLGKEIAQELAKSDIVVSLSRQGLSELDSDGTKERYELYCDVTKPDTIEDALQKIITKYGRIDVLINNAGIWLQGAIDENQLSDIEQVIKVNTLGTLSTTAVAVRFMKNKKNGLIININSQAGITAKGNMAVYFASKWAITGFTQCLQDELAPFGIKVTGIYPGKMKTNLFRKSGIEKDLSNAIDVAEVVPIISLLIANADTDYYFPAIGIKHLNN